ncbi:MAG: large conductance mechanosensitive channel protein MscL [Deltaproteobacteria bacterium]|nr:MAG: large conductance mechanosensitive channel protein MscL [Deltaproteobacteria bacterium]RTZ97978.1 MAG: large conductance mechanosensitive channel protein MscL [Deltaproteobacteria bacterium]
MMKEFKEFALKGNVVDMAVGIVIGGAFGKIIASFVSDVIMPPIGLLLGGVDFSNLAITLKEGAEGVEPVLMKYGVFFNTIINFIIIALAIFFVVKKLNRLQEKLEGPEEEEEVTTKDCPYCLSEIPIKATRCPNCTSEQ